MALSAAVTTCINNCATRVTQLDPGANATVNTATFTTICNDWPNVPGGVFGQKPWDASRAEAFCNWMTSIGVDTTALRSFFGVA